MNIPSKSELKKIYGETEKSAVRFQNLLRNFQKIYHHEKAEFFSAPGRTEIIGNHTDHNGGLVIAGSIDMDTIGAAYPNGSNIIRITSEGYGEIAVDLSDLNSSAQKKGTKALTAGMAEAVRKFGFNVSGFDAYISSEVISAAGVSSSASFEMLICSVINYFFNNGSMNCTDYAKIGQYAENIYWNKASGLMDQLTCAAGGIVLMDFADKNNPAWKKINFSFKDIGYQSIIVNTGDNHADLSREYSEIPFEMSEAASTMNLCRLCETNLENLLSNIKNVKNDRAILRAIHFFEENQRVKNFADEIENKNSEKLLTLLTESGTSSWELLQNCYCVQDCKQQKIPLILALSKLFLKKAGSGACRIHGGGFAGVIMCVVPENEKENYISYISNFVGRENVYPVNVRASGAVHIQTDI